MARSGVDERPLDHDVFAKSANVMADIKALLTSSLRPPGDRDRIRILPAPINVTPSTYWRYVPPAAPQ